MKTTRIGRKCAPGLVVAAAFLTLVAASAVLAVTVTEGSRTVQSQNLILQWSGSEQEAIVTVRWDRLGNPAAAPNWTNSSNVGECPDPFAPEYWGNAWVGGAPQNGEPVIVGLGTVTPAGETAWAPAFGRKGAAVHSQSADCSAPFEAAGVPVTTRYKLYDHGPRAHVVRLDRTIDFSGRPLKSSFRPYIPRLRRNLGFEEVLYPASYGTLVTVDVDVCPFGCVRPDWDATAGWFAVHSAALGQGLVVKRAPTASISRLWVDWDGASFTTASSFLLEQPPGGFTSAVEEKMVLCFYDAAAWPVADRQALKLPAACGVDGALD